MKLKFLTVIALFFSLCGYAQTKGTNALSFGINTNKTEFTNSQSTNENKNNSFTLGYGIFNSDQSKIGFELMYGQNESSYDNILGSEGKNYGGNVSYQYYYRIIKTLSAYAGGKAGYMYSKSSLYSSTDDTTEVQEQTGNQYSVGAYGGITWFVSKRFAFETSLLSANMMYATSEQQVSMGYGGHKLKLTNFNLTTQGFIDNLGFKIYILF